jgi:hypothetical protein
MDNYYVIIEDKKNASNFIKKFKKAKIIKKSFIYNSGNNKAILKIKELKNLIKEYQLAKNL